MHWIAWLGIPGHPPQFKQTFKVDGVGGSVGTRGFHPGAGGLPQPHLPTGFKPGFPVRGPVIPAVGVEAGLCRRAAGWR